MAKDAHPDKFCAGRYTPHVMRHTTASHLVEAGVPLAIVKNILGHVSIQSTQIYVEITQQTVDKYMKEWNEKWFPKEETKQEILPNIQSSLPEFLQYKCGSLALRHSLQDVPCLSLFRIFKAWPK